MGRRRSRGWGVLQVLFLRGKFSGFDASIRLAGNVDGVGLAGPAGGNRGRAQHPRVSGAVDYDFLSGGSLEGPRECLCFGGKCRRLW